MIWILRSSFIVSLGIFLGGCNDSPKSRPIEKPAVVPEAESSKEEPGAVEWTIGKPVFPSQNHDLVNLFEDSHNRLVDLRACRSTRNICLGFYYFPKEIKLARNPENNALMLSHAIYSPTGRGNTNPRFDIRIQYNLTFDDTDFPRIETDLRESIAKTYQILESQIRLMKLPTKSIQAVALPRQVVEPVGSRDYLKLATRLFSTSAYEFKGFASSRRTLSFGQNYSWDIEPAFQQALVSEVGNGDLKVNLIFDVDGVFRPGNAMAECDLKAFDEWLDSMGQVLKRVRLVDYNTRSHLSRSAWSVLKTQLRFEDFCVQAGVDSQVDSLLFDVALNRLRSDSSKSLSMEVQEDQSALFSLSVALNSEGLTKSNLNPTYNTLCGRSEKLVRVGDSYQCEKVCDQETEFYFPDYPTKDERGCVKIEQFNINEAQHR